MYIYIAKNDTLTFQCQDTMSSLKMDIKILAFGNLEKLNTYKNSYFTSPLNCSALQNWPETYLQLSPQSSIQRATSRKGIRYFLSVQLTVHSEYLILKWFNSCYFKEYTYLLTKTFTYGLD